MAETRTGEAARLSKMLFEARELIDMFGDVTELQSGQNDTWARRVRDELDEYRAERGWSPHGFGNEVDEP
jgi:5-methylcytosine-specific restriction endonuclease McrBC regulatory subunit McrC